MYCFSAVCYGWCYAWKACMRLKRITGSNPVLSACNTAAMDSVHSGRIIVMDMPDIGGSTVKHGFLFRYPAFGHFSFDIDNCHLGICVCHYSY